MAALYGWGSFTGGGGGGSGRNEPYWVTGRVELLEMQQKLADRNAEYLKKEHELMERMDYERRQMYGQRSMANPYLQEPQTPQSVKRTLPFGSVPDKAVSKCKSCGEGEHGGKIDMIGYCENKLKKHYKNLSKLVSKIK